MQSKRLICLIILFCFAFFCVSYAYDPKALKSDNYQNVKRENPYDLKSAQGIVVDKKNGLNWMQNANCIASHYPEFDTSGTPKDGKINIGLAYVFIEKLNNGDFAKCNPGKFSNWRLPTIEEFKSLSDFNYEEPVLPPKNPFKHVKSSYWVSEWSVYSSKDGSAYYPCVRSPVFDMTFGTINAGSVCLDFFYFDRGKSEIHNKENHEWYFKDANSKALKNDNKHRHYLWLVRD